MKRKFFHRILPVIMAVLMVIGTLPSDLGFSMTADAGNSGNDVRIGGSGEAHQYNVTVNVTITNLKYDRVDDKPIKFKGSVGDDPLAGFDSGNGLTATAKFSCDEGELNEKFEYTITSDNYIITDNGSPQTIKGTFNLTKPESGDQVMEDVTIDASNWDVTPNFPRATTLTLSAKPDANSAGKWGEKVTLTATATSDSEKAPVSEQSVQFYVDGQSIASVTTNDQGVATYEWTSTPGTHIFKADSKTIDGKYVGASAEISGYKLQPHGSSLTLTVPQSKPWNEAVEIKAELTDESGAVIKEAGREITFTFDGENPQTVATDADGVATLSYTPGSKGTDSIEIKASFAGDDSYVASTVAGGSYTATTVKPKLSLSPKPQSGGATWQKGVELIGTLTYWDGKDDVPISNEKISVAVSDGQTVEGTTGSNGEVTLEWTPKNAAKVKITASHTVVDSRFSQADDAVIQEYSPLLVTPTLNVEVSEKSPWKSDVTITGTLTDEKGAVNGAELIFTIDGTEIDRETTDNDGKASIIWKPTSAKEVKITVSYGGKADYYNSAASEVNYKPELETQSFTISDSESNPVKDNASLELTYGNNTAEFTLNPVNEDGYPDVSSDFEVQASDSNIISAKVESGKLIITPENAGTATVTIIQAENDNYEASTKTLTFTVLPYELNLAAKNPVTTQGNEDQGGKSENSWSNEKIYDGTNIVDARAQVDLSDDALSGLSPDQKTALKKLFTEDAGNYYLVREGVEAISGEGESAVSVTHVSDSDKAFNVTFTIPKSDGGYQNFVFASKTDDGQASPSITEETKVTILQRKLKLFLSREFRRQFNMQNVNDQGQPNVVLPEDVITDVSGFPDNEIFNRDQDAASVKAAICALEAGWDYLTINSDKIGPSTPLGTYDNAVYMSVDQLKAFNEDELSKVSGDYIFADVEKGSVIIGNEVVTDFTKYLSLNTAVSKNVYQNGDKIYFGQDASAVFNAGEPYNTVYRVLLGENGQIAEWHEITGEDPQTFVDASAETYLYVLAEIDGEGTVGETDPFEITFYRDQKMPTANIVIGEVDNAVQEFGKNITFGLYNNTTFEAQITVKDEEGQNQQDYASGVESVSYKIVNFAEDYDFGADSTVIDDEVFEALMESEFTAISSEGDITAGENGVFTASVKVPEKDPEEIGNYVVFVRVQDNVGNAMIYGSNGMIFENVPITDVTINFDEASNDSKTNYKGGDYFANGEAVNLFITANEEMAANVYSGVEEINYSVESENKDGITFATTPEDGRFYQAPPEGVTLEQLANEYSSYTGYINNIYTAKDQSQIVTVTASARDFAGNESQTVSRTFTIDPVAPAIENALTSQAQVQNGKYYNKDVVITTTITERFLDMEQKLMYSINGSAYMTLSELVNRQEEFGISGIAIDYGKDGNVGENRFDQSQSTVTITFHEDGEYTISAYVSDYAGNVSETTQAIDFVVDQTAPVASVTYYSYGQGQTFTPGTSASAPYYLNQNYSSFKAVVSVSELNFDMNGNVNTNLAIGAKDVDNNTSDAMAAIINTHGTNVKSAQNWSDPSGITRTYTVDVNVDANYSFDFAYTDLAGNEANVIPTGYVTLDRVAPEGSITVSGFVNGVGENSSQTAVSWIKEFISSITFGLFGKDQVTASMTSGDATAGVASTQYIATSELLTKAQLASRSGWTEYTGGNINLPANENVIVYEKVTDKAGNTEYYSTENIVVDNVDPAPEVTITPSAPAWGKGVYKKDDNPGFDISVTDPSVNNAYSGLKEITYQIVNGTTGHTETGTLATFARDQHTQTWTGHVSIDPEAFYSNDVQVTVTASDWSTNQAVSETKTLKVDYKAPIVTFSFSTADALNGKYYKNNKTLTITVDERNFDPSYTPTVTSSSGGGYSFSGWSSNGEIHTGVVTFSGDSDYTVTFDCYDLAGNLSNPENLPEFTVDKTLPTVSVSYNNNDVLNGHYYSDTRTATITITEHNFRASEVRVTTTASLNGSSISAPSVGGWSTSGDRHTATVSFPTDGDYTFDIAYTDLAGNAMADYPQDSFTVDLTDPEIEITGVENRSANKGTVAPVITLTDTNYTANGVSLTLTGANKGRVNVDTMVSRSAVANGQTITFRNFGENMDDIYTLTAKLTDQAGNETTRSITFSVNRDGSTYELDDYVAQLIEKGFTNDPQDIVIKETNVDTLEFIEITYSKDGQVVTLEEGVDYTVEEEGGDGQWKVYTYTIKASCFEEEGQYSINIYSEDRAQNTSTNQVKEKSIEFIVDKTAPSVSIANLEDRGRYRENVHEFTLSVKDNMLLSYVELYLDGELVRTYTGDELTVEDGVLTIPVDSKNAYQTVKIIAYDAAGNPTDPVEYQVLVTSNWWIQFYMNKPLFFGCIAGIVVIAGVIIILVAKRRKKA